MYEGLVKRLLSYADLHCPLDRSSGICGCIDAREAAEAILQLSKPRWIPVTERLPEKRKWVLCRCEAGIIDVLRYENAEWYHDPTHVYFFEFVIHWMPLPTPPREET